MVEEVSLEVYVHRDGRGGDGGMRPKSTEEAKRRRRRLQPLTADKPGFKVLIGERRVRKRDEWTEWIAGWQMRGRCGLFLYICCFFLVYVSGFLTKQEPTKKEP